MPSSTTANIPQAGEALNSFVYARYRDYIATLRANAPTVLLVGDTGLGKSSLVNLLFDLKLGDEQYAQVSHGKPCTQNFAMYGPSDRSPVRIIDSKGVEKMTVDVQIAELVNYIGECSRKRNVQEQVHLIYYFVGMCRWQDADTEYVKTLRRRCGVILVINKRDLRQDEEVRELREEIRTHFPDIHIAECGDPRGTRTWIPATCKYNHGEDYLEISMRNKRWECCYTDSFTPQGDPIFCEEWGDDSPFGHKELVSMSLDLLPELVRPSFRSAQRVDLTKRHTQAAVIIGSSTATAAGVGATPVPFADLPVLLALEGLMAAGLMAVYGVPLESFNGQTLMALNTGIIGIGGTVGYVTAQMLKSVPGVGTVAGGSIDAMVAGTAVLTLGVAMAAVLTKWLLEGGENDVAEEISETAKELKLGDVVKGMMAGVREQGNVEEHIAATIERTVGKEPDRGGRNRGMGRF